jgi:hypothetical protein
MSSNLQLTEEYVLGYGLTSEVPEDLKEAMRLNSLALDEMRATNTTPELGSPKPRSD